MWSSWARVFACVVSLWCGEVPSAHTLLMSMAVHGRVRAAWMTGTMHSGMLGNVKPAWLGWWEWVCTVGCLYSSIWLGEVLVRRTVPLRRSTTSHSDLLRPQSKIVELRQRGQGRRPR